jgi:AcrR family transcriptional regulator
MPGSRATPKRPRKRGRRPKTYAAVLAATSSLLESVPLAELSVAQILDVAAVGRTSFYEHFSSKDDVVVKLLRSISVEVAAELEPMFERGERGPDEAFGEGISDLMRISSRYAALLVAVTEEWPAVPELRRIWFRMQGGLTARLAEAIERDRAAGIAPAGADSEALAASLIWAAERAFHIAMIGDHPTLVDQAALVEPLVQLFVGTIYGRPVQRERPSRAEHQRGLGVPTP